ncbi:hypothetical protein FN846DRAFT_894701, partial [Sphaerosporella brunnea]
MTSAAHPFEDPADPIVSSQMGDTNDADDMVMDLQGASQWSEPILTPTPTPTPMPIFTPNTVPPPPPPPHAEPQDGSQALAPTPTPPTPGALGAPRMTHAMTRGLSGQPPLDPKRPTPTIAFNGTPVQPLAESRKRQRNEEPESNRLMES